MQSVDGFPTDLTVSVPGALVTVNGSPVDVGSVSVTRELSSSLPAQVTSASGITAATGSVEWAVGGDVLERSAHPWDGNAFPPKPADDVVVFMGYGDVLARQLTGVVDSTSGGVADGDVSSSVADPIDRLNRPVSFPPHMSVMPPYDEGGPFLTVNNSPMFTTDRVLRACGFYATPPVDPGCILSVPLMGSAWPERGRVDAAGQQGNPSFPPSFNAAQWGLAVNSIEASYTPDTSSWPTSRLDKTLQITVKVRNVVGSSGTVAIRAWWGSTRVSVGISAARTITANGFDGTTSTTVATMSSSAAWSADVFTLRVTSAGVFTIYANNGATATGTYSLPSAMTTTNMTRVQITGPHITGAHIGGVQVGFSTSKTWEHPQTATLTPSASNLGLPAMPAINGRVALEVLKEQAEAECAAMWIDEFGGFRWVNRDTLVGAAPVATLTALDDVLDVGWESDASGVRSLVEVRSRQARITRFPVSSVTLYQGRGESLQSGQSTTDIIEPGADESWFNVIDGLWTHAELNRGEKTMLGGVVVKDAAEDVWAFNVGKLSWSFERLSTEKFAITHTAGTLASGETVVLKTSETDTLLRPFRRDKPLPIVRGKARVRWTDIVTASTVLGPADAAALEHEVGPWVQDPAALQELADWLGAQVSAPRPVLRDLAVVPDFRRQLGDVVWVEDLENMRVRLKVLITKLSTSVSDGSAEQSIAGRILEVLHFGTTNAQLDGHAGTKTNAGFDTLWADATNAQLDADPLGRG